MIVWAIIYKIDGRWQRDGEWYCSRSGALDQARQNKKDFGWLYRVCKARINKLAWEGELP